MKKQRSDLKIVAADLSLGSEMPFSKRSPSASSANAPVAVAATTAAEATPETAAAGAGQPSGLPAPSATHRPAAATKPPRRKAAGAKPASNRVGTIATPYTRQRDQVETISLRITVPKALRKDVAVYCAERELPPSQAWELAMRTLLKQA